MNTAIALLISVLLLAANAFFVGAEFAIVAAKRHRLEERASAGSRSARAAMHASRELSLMLAGAQLGITLCTLALGALAKPAMANLLEPVIELLGVPEWTVHAVAVVFAVAIVVFLHMVVGEMAPKSWAISHPEASAMMVAIPFRLFTWVMRPVIWLMNALANGILRLSGIEPVDSQDNAQTPAELQLLLSQSHEHGVLADADHQILSGALKLEEETVGSVMLPLEELVAIGADKHAIDVEALSLSSGRSRLFVIDHRNKYRGIVHVRDAVLASAAGGKYRPVTDFLQMVPSLPIEMPLIDAVSSLRQQHAQLALVRDRNGRVIGMTSMEDMLEQILGEFDDESDESSAA